MASIVPVALIVLGALLFPVAGVVLCLLVLGTQIAFMIIRAAVGRRDVPHPVNASVPLRPIFSIHVATHNEPPQVVARTLRALRDQNWPADRFEVIIMDNNTADPALWTPLHDLCDRLGPGFRFFHETGVLGAKAGALNIALARTRADATHIVTVDADYVVEPRFLDHAAQALHATGADYVQFPQAYVGSDRAAAGVDAELEEYFRTNAQMADDSEAVLLTGTLCVISRLALVAAGGWSGRTTTEDAEMGVRLCRKGFSGRFINRIVGRGYMPLSLRDLARQRHRWAGGNLRTLLVHAPAILFGGDQMGWRRRGAILSQLSAWLNLALLPALILLAALLTGLGGPVLVLLAAVCVLVCLVDIAGRLAWRGFRDRTAWPVIAAAVVHRMALAPVSALATVDVLLGRTLTYVVTDKSGASGRDIDDVPFSSLLLFGLAALAIPNAAEQGLLSFAAVCALMTPLPAALATARTLKRYRSILTTSRPGVPA